MRGLAWALGLIGLAVLVITVTNLRQTMIVGDAVQNTRQAAEWNREQLRAVRDTLDARTAWGRRIDALEVRTDTMETRVGRLEALSRKWVWH